MQSNLFYHLWFLFYLFAPPLLSLLLLNLCSSSVLPHSQSSSCSPSPALSTESLSSGSDHSSSQPPLPGGASSDQEHAFTKSVSEPSICTPCDSAASACSSSNEQLPHLSPSQPSMPIAVSSAPATPQTSRSSEAKGAAAPPPRLSMTPSPLASGAPHSHNKVTGDQIHLYARNCTYSLYIIFYGKGEVTTCLHKNDALFFSFIDINNHLFSSVIFHLWVFSLFSGSVRRTLSTGKPRPPLLNPKADRQKAHVLPDPQPLAMASHLSNAR